jgi:hypothetical protein
MKDATAVAAPTLPGSPPGAWLRSLVARPTAYSDSNFIRPRRRPSSYSRPW